MIGAAAVDIQQGVLRRFPKPDTKELITLLYEAIAEGIAVLGFPGGALLWQGVLGVEEVVAVGEQG